MRSLIVLFLLLSSIELAYAQTNPIDRYLSRKSVPEVIANANDLLQGPRDLDFCRVAGREHELWVVNKNGFVIIIYDAGKPSQWSEFRRDAHSSHFMQRPTGIAMGANGNFGTSPESGYDAGQQFMGPVLWTSDTSIFARIHQWDAYLGSHSDMLHESQYAMGIAADTGNVYWVFDGYHDAIYRYDFGEPHPYGGDDHSDGIIHGYFVGVKRTKELPSHLVLEEETGWLYTVDNGNNRLLRLQTRSGEYGEDLGDALEPLKQYGSINGAVTETFETGIQGLCGIDIWEDRLIVSVNSTGEIRIYNTATPQPTYLGSIHAEPGIMGVKIGPDSAIWYVNYNENTLVRLSAEEPLSVADAGPNQNSVYPSPARNVINLGVADDVQEIRVVNTLGNVIRIIPRPGHRSQIDVRDLPNGVYYCQFMDAAGFTQQRFILAK